jgi:hypothetical protein
LQNYDDVNNAESPLHTLIPRPDGKNGKCRMYIESMSSRPWD